MTVYEKSEWDEKNRCTCGLGWLSWQKRQTKEKKNSIYSCNWVFGCLFFLDLILINSKQGQVWFTWLQAFQSLVSSSGGKKDMTRYHKLDSNINFVFLSSQTVWSDVNVEEDKWQWKLSTCLSNSDGTSGSRYWESPWPVKHSNLQKHQISLKRKRRMRGSFEEKKKKEGKTLHQVGIR